MMGNHYLVKCDCGHQLSVEGRQAGQSLACACGKTVRVPTLRQLRALPQAGSETVRSPKRWTQGQGITFVAGAVVTAMGLGLVVYLVPQRLGLDMAESSFDRFLRQEDLDSLTPEDAYSAWQAYRSFGLRWGHTPQYLGARRRAITLNTYLGVAGGAALLGGLLVCVALFYMPSGQPRPKRGR